MRKSERFSSLKNEIENATKKQIQALEKSYQQLHDEEIDRYKSDLEVEIKRNLSNELSLLKKEELRFLSTNKIAYRQALLNYRKNLVDELFNDLANRLQDFTNTPAYKEWLVTKTESVLKAEGSLGGVLACGKTELTILSEIIKKNSLTTKEINNEIGGFVFTNKQNTIEYDYRLTSVIAKQRKWFHLNSGFIIQEVKQ